MFRAMRLLLSSSGKKNGAAVPGGSSSSSRFVVGHFLSSTPSSSQRLAGMTGTASGIGRVTTAEFVRNGAKVVLADVHDELGVAAAAELGPDASYTRRDVTDKAKVAAAADLAITRHGRLDVLFNNAGVASAISSALGVESLDLANFDRVIAINLRGVATGIKHAARVMVPRRAGGCILCTAITEAVLGGSGLYAYGVSKAAIVGMVRSMAGQLARHGVRVNIISPYAIATPLSTPWVRVTVPGGASDEEVRRMFEVDLNEMHGAVLRAEDVARAAVSLASDDGQYGNGHNLVVDGGFTVGKRLNILFGTHNMFLFSQGQNRDKRTDVWALMTWRGKKL